MNDHAADLDMRVNQQRLDLEAGHPLLAGRLEGQLYRADPAVERPPHFLGRNGESDRIHRPHLGHGHAEELTGLLVDDRAAAVARLERTVYLEQVDMPVRVPLEPRDQPAGNRDLGVALALGDLAEHPAQREAGPDIRHSRGRFQPVAGIDRRRRLIQPLDQQERQVRLHLVGEIGGDDLGREGLLLRESAPEDGFDRRHAPLGKEAVGQLGEVGHGDVPVGRHEHPIAVDLDHESAPRRDSLPGDLVLDVDRSILELTEDLLVIGRRGRRGDRGRRRGRGHGERGSWRRSHRGPVLARDGRQRRRGDPRGGGCRGRCLRDRRCLRLSRELGLGNRRGLSSPTAAARQHQGQDHTQQDDHQPADPQQCIQENVVPGRGWGTGRRRS